MTTCPCAFGPGTSPSHHEHGSYCDAPASNVMAWTNGVGGRTPFCDACAEALLEDGIVVPANEADERPF